MTYTEFVCECVIRLGAIQSPNAGGYQVDPDGCLWRALQLADLLVEQSILEPTFEMLRVKFEAYDKCVRDAEAARRSSLSEDKLDTIVLTKIQESIKTKKYFYRIADLLKPQLVEAGLFENGKLEIADKNAKVVLQFFYHPYDECHSDLNSIEQKWLAELEKLQDNRQRRVLQEMLMERKEVREALIQTKDYKPRFIEAINMAARGKQQEE
jgi:hypothetical protein